MRDAHAERHGSFGLFTDVDDEVSVERMKGRVQQFVFDVIHTIGVDSDLCVSKHLHSSGIQLLMDMLQHSVSSHRDRRTFHFEMFADNTRVHVIVLAAPAPVISRVAIDQEIMLTAHS